MRVRRGIGRSDREDDKSNKSDQIKLSDGTNLSVNLSLFVTV